MNRICTILFLTIVSFAKAQGTCDCCSPILFYNEKGYEFLFPSEQIQSKKVESVLLTYREIENDTFQLLFELHFNKKGFVTKAIEYNYAKYRNQKRIKRKWNQKVTFELEMYSDSLGLTGSPNSYTTLTKYDYNKRSYTSRNYFWMGNEKDHEHYHETIFLLDSVGRIASSRSSGEKSAYPDSTIYTTTYSHSKNNDSLIERSYVDGILSSVDTKTYTNDGRMKDVLSHVISENGDSRVRITYEYNDEHQLRKISSVPLDNTAFTECLDQSNYSITIHYENGFISEVHYEYVDRVYRFKNQHFVIKCDYVLR